MADYTASAPLNDGPTIEAALLSSHEGKIKSYTQVQFALLDATTWGDSPLLVNDVVDYAYVQYVSNGVDFVESFRVDNNGEMVVGGITPRVDTLLGLEQTIGNAGELASASDAAAIIKFTGGGEAGGEIFRLGDSFKTINSVGLTEVSVDVDYVLIDFVDSGNVVTLQEGYREGQMITVQGKGLESGPINGVLVDGITYALVPLNALGIGAALTFAYIDGAWAAAASPSEISKNKGLTVDAINPANGSIALGGCKNFGNNSVLEGDKTLSSGDYCRNSSVAGHSEERFPSSFSAISNTSSATILGSVITVVAGSFIGDELAIGNKVTLSNDWYHLSTYEGEISAIAAGTFDVTIAATDIPKFSGMWLRIIPHSNNNGPRYAQSNGLAPYITTEGQSAIGWPGHASNTLSSGCSQTTETRLIGRTVDVASSILLSNIDNSPASFGVLFNTNVVLQSVLDFRTFLTKQGKAYCITATIFAKNVGLTDSSMAIFKRQFGLFNNAGVQALTTIETVCPDIKQGVLASLVAPVFQVNDTDQTLEVNATGVAGQTIGWMCELHAIEIKMAS